MNIFEIILKIAPWNTFLIAASYHTADKRIIRLSDASKTKEKGTMTLLHFKVVGKGDWRRLKKSGASNPRFGEGTGARIALARFASIGGSRNAKKIGAWESRGSLLRLRIPRMRRAKEARYKESRRWRTYKVWGSRSTRTRAAENVNGASGSSHVPCFLRKETRIPRAAFIAGVVGRVSHSSLRRPGSSLPVVKRLYLEHFFSRVKCRLVIQFAAD